MRHSIVFTGVFRLHLHQLLLNLTSTRRSVDLTRLSVRLTLQTVSFLRHPLPNASPVLLFHELFCYLFLFPWFLLFLVYFEACCLPDCVWSILVVDNVLCLSPFFVFVSATLLSTNYWWSSLLSIFGVYFEGHVSIWVRLKDFETVIPLLAPFDLMLVWLYAALLRGPNHFLINYLLFCSIFFILDLLLRTHPCF